MKAESKKMKSLDFRQPHLKNVFITVSKRLADEYNRSITADAVNKAYRRGDSIVFDLVKEEVEKCVKKYEKEQANRRLTLIKKEKFEEDVIKKLQTI